MQGISARIAGKWESREPTSAEPASGQNLLGFTKTLTWHYQSLIGADSMNISHDEEVTVERRVLLWVRVVLVNHWDSGRGGDSREALETLAVLLTPTKWVRSYNQSILGSSVGYLCTSSEAVSTATHNEQWRPLTVHRTMSQSFHITLITGLVLCWSLQG